MPPQRGDRDLGLPRNVGISYSPKYPEGVCSGYGSRLLLASTYAAILEAQFGSLGFEASSIAPGEHGTKATLHSEVGIRLSDGTGRAIEQKGGGYLFSRTDLAPKFDSAPELGGLH